MNQTAMNNQNTSHSKPSQGRHLNSPTGRTRFARFSVEDESEGVELFLRALLLTSLIVSLMICHGYLTAGRSQPSVLPTHDTVIASAQHAAAVPAAAAL